jgi:Flp pilus assembly protein TadG
VLRHRGGALLEAAVVLPVLLYLALGTIEFGYYFYAKHACEGAAREGARAAIVSGSAYSDVTSAVTTSMTNSNYPASTYTVTTVVQDNGTTVTNLSSAVAGDEMTVTVSMNWSAMGAQYMAFNFIGLSKVISGTAVMRHE